MKNLYKLRPLAYAFKTLVSIAVLLALFSASGCTVVGFTVGAAMDASQSKTEIVKSDFANKVRKHELVKIILDDSSQVNGRCSGRVKLSDSSYLAYFQESDSLSGVTPTPGESIFMITGFKDSLEGTFLGYEQIDKPKRRYVAGSSSYDRFSSTVCRISESERDSPTDIFLHRIASMNSTDSLVYNPSLIRKLASRNELPLLSVLEVSTDSGKRFVQYSDINRVEHPAKKNSKWKLMAVGAAVDVVSLIIFALTWDMGSGGWGY